MKLISTAMKFEHVGDDGYSFSVEASQDDETGWSAYVSMAAHGSVSPHGAIAHLRHSAEAFLRALDDMEKSKEMA